MKVFLIDGQINLKFQLDLFNKKLIQNDLKKNSIKKYNIDINQFIDFVDNRKLSKKLMNEYRNLLFTKYAVSTANGKAISINKYLKFINQKDLIIKLKHQQVANTLDNLITIDEFKKCLSIAESRKDHKRMYYILLTLIQTGMRVGELKYLTLGTVKQGYIKNIEHKRKIRSIAIPENLCSDLIHYAENHKINKSDQQIFVTKSGKPVDPRYIWQEFKKIGIQAGVDPDKIHPHALRHLFAKTYISQFHDLGELADILGHSNLNVTKIYTKTSIREKQRNISSLKF